MSTSNAILIKKIGPKIEVREINVDAFSPEFPGFLIAAFEYNQDGLIEAIKKTQEYCAENIVEYGVMFAGF